MRAWNVWSVKRSSWEAGVGHTAHDEAHGPGILPIGEHGGGRLGHVRPAVQAPRNGRLGILRGSPRPGGARCAARPRRLYRPLANANMTRPRAPPGRGSKHGADVQCAKDRRSVHSRRSNSPPGVVTTGWPTLASARKRARTRWVLRWPVLLVGQARTPARLAVGGSDDVRRHRPVLPPAALRPPPVGRGAPGDGGSHPSEPGGGSKSPVGTDRNARNRRANRAAYQRCSSIARRCWPMC